MASVKISDFVASWLNVLPADYCSKTNKLSHECHFQKELQLDKDMAAELDSVCSIDALECKGEVGGWSAIEKHNFLQSVPNGVLLLTTDFQKAELNKRNSDKRRQAMLTRDLKGKPNDGQVAHMLSQIEEDYKQTIQVPDAVVSVKVAYPLPVPGLIRTLQEFHILGQQKLTDLKDAINCEADHVPIGDFSENPDLPQVTLSKDLYKSGFFFIEDTFYNDMRDTNNRDYSQTIIEWAKEKRRKLGPFGQAKMEETYIRDLTIKLDSAYLYQHQGGCEHLIFFTDLRMLHREDCWDLSFYPLQLERSRVKRINCKACINNLALWAVRDSPHAPEDPCFFCETCFRMLHYDEHGKKLGQFDAYPFQTTNTTCLQ